jgi:hypothetical protein
VELIINRIDVPRDDIEEKWTEPLPTKSILELQGSGVDELPEGLWGKPSIKNKKNCKVRLYWYLDFSNRHMIDVLSDVCEPLDTLITADITCDFSKYDISPELIYEQTMEAMFYQKIFKLIKEGLSSWKISEAVSNEQFKISHNQVNEMRKLYCV